MSKKGQKNQPQKKEIEIVDQQKDPMLRALQKKVRNMNKKLNQITQLSAKKDLKPEQEQKISKKNQILQEKEKYLQMIETYKEISGESEKAIRKLQIVELQDLAALIAMKEYQVDLGFLFNQNVDNLVRILTTPTSGDLNLRQRIDQIVSSLTETANNTKLKKTIRDFVQQNPTKQKVAPQTVSNQPEPLSSQSQKERQAQIKQLQQEQKNQPAKVVYQPTQPTPASNPPPQEQPKTQVVQTPQVTQPLNQKVQDNPQTVSAPAQVSSQENKSPSQRPNENNQPKATQNQENNGKPERRGYNRGYRGGKGGDKNNQRYNGERRPNKKPSFKPKYQEVKKTEERNDSSSLESSDQQPKARQFKKEQVKELIEDGFIVVGKPKVKARDQKQWHDRQHGRKNYHNKNSKTNY